MHRTRAIESIKAFLPEDAEIELAIRFCDLHPCQGSWRKWSDNQGNFVQVYNTKKLVSFTHNPLDQEERIVTDLYFKAHPKKIASISKWAFVSFGRDNSDSFRVCFIWFLGHDGRLRMVTLKRDEWIKNSPPLICGIDVLKPIIRATLLEGQRADILNVKGPVAANITCSWATKWPPQEKILNEMNAKNKGLAEKVKELCHH